MGDEWNGELVIPLSDRQSIFAHYTIVFWEFRLALSLVVPRRFGGDVSHVLNELT
jgi:hypothetical protein